MKLYIVTLLLLIPIVFGQTYLRADGSSDAYSVINKVLGKTTEETPDCAHPSFGKHITQTFDDQLQRNCFVFYLHVSPDNDGCTKFDRQRTEIKTYKPSPPYLIGLKGETVSFSWNFKLDSGFQPSESFTHIHQIKSGDGEDGSPIITLTPRKGSPDILQLIHIDSKGVTTVLGKTNLGPFKGTWVHVVENMTYNSNGKHSIVITRLIDGAELFSLTTDKIDLWRTGTTFVRPKWGIYRSLTKKDQLRNEAVRFDTFCLAKGKDRCL